MRIFLNPGHHPKYDSGAVDPISGLRECDVALNISNYVKSILEDSGMTVMRFQSDSLSEICVQANRSNADYFISIHCNAFNQKAHGTEVEVYSLSSEAANLAQSVQTAIVKSLYTTDRGVKERPGLYVLRYTDMPAILVETAFIDNPDDVKLLTNNQADFAEAIARGILTYLNMTPKSQPDTTKLSPKGIPYEENDILYLTNLGYTRIQALSMLDLDPKYRNSALERAVSWADSMTGREGYGNNGCTEFCKNFLLQANNPLGQFMKDGSQGNLMWVPNLYYWAKENNLFKEPFEGACLGDVVLLETNGNFYDGPDHVVISAGGDLYWGNSSSRNKIVKSSISYDYGEDHIHGFIHTGTGAPTVVLGASQRTDDEIRADAGSTSIAELSKNGSVFSDDDILYLTQQGLTLQQTQEILNNQEKYVKPYRIAPNGKCLEYNDLLYLLNNGYTESAACELLFSCEKYCK